MKKEKKTLTVRKIGNMLIINDELYEPIWCSSKKDSELLRFRRIDKGKFEKLKEEISDKLKSQLKSKDIINNALADLSLRALEKIDEELKKSKPRIKKQHGCYEVIVGRTSIPIR